MVSRSKKLIITITVTFTVLLLLAIILPIVSIRQKDRGSSKSNASISDPSPITSTSSQFTTMEIFSEEVTDDPLTTVFYASKNALRHWTVDGSVFVDNGVRYPFLSGSWYICGTNGSSMSRSFALNDEQIAIYYLTSQLQVATHYIGDIEVSKTPTCNRLTATVLANKTESVLDDTSEKTYRGRFLICRDDVDMTLKVTFLNTISCVKHMFMSLWNAPKPG